MTSEGRLAIVEDDPLLLDQLRWALKKKFDVVSADNAVDGLALLESEPDLFLLDLRLPPTNEAEAGLDLLREVRRRRPGVTVVVMTGETDRAYALRAVELGAYDFFRKPVDKDELELILRRALERQRIMRENRELREQVRERVTFERIVGSSAPMRALFRAIEKVAPSDATVLIVGESGTGKELVAQALHSGSPRAGGPFVAVNSSALTESLAESELFGHEKGAFTGAVASRPGKFELAHGGTLFLDEVATLSQAVQAKLLRVLESREFERVGGKRSIAVDIRLIAATNEDLEAEATAGRFRQDLFFRLNTVTLRLPPLRDRPEDIPLLVEFFAERFARRHGKPVKAFAPEVVEAFRRYRWRGNVRELEHLIEMLTLMVDEDVVRPGDLPGAFREAGSAAGGEEAGGDLRAAVARFEKGMLQRAIEAAGGVKARAARGLGLDPNQMKYLCRKYGL